MTGHGWGASAAVGLTARPQAKSRREGIRRQKSLARSRFRNFMPAGKIDPFFYKTGNGTSSIYRGGLPDGWAWLAGTPPVKITSGGDS
jgi:hypothetical protein